MNESKKRNYFEYILIILFVIFLILYFYTESGYYEYKTHEKTILTNEAIKQFEKDVEEGKNVSINDYVTSEYVDYSNFISDVGYKTGTYIEKFMKTGIKKSLKIMGELFVN